MKNCLRNLILILSVSSSLFASEPPFNPLTVDAGDDLIICAPGQTVTLDGSVLEPISGVSWEPSTGMSDPNSLNPEVYVSSTTTFTLTAFGFGATTNLIVNGDFEAGNSGFISDYIYDPNASPTNILDEGFYAITNDASAVHSGFDPCSDHTGGGNMMVVNGSGTPGTNVWCQIVAVSPNTIYEFSAWATSVNPGSPAILQFSINGILLGNSFTLTTNTCSWDQFFETWDSGGNPTAEICIVNQNTTLGGNDFALDDITFGPVCTGEDQVTVTVVDALAIVDPFALIPCTSPNATVTLNGMGSTTGPDVTYLWTTADGNIVSGENTLEPVVDAPGFYELTVSIPTSFGPCESSAFVEVLNDIPPEAVATTSNNIDCISPLGTVSGVGSTVGPVTYSWTTNDGAIVSGADEIIASVGQAGTYTLLVTDILTGCTAEASTEVISNLVFPTAIVDSTANLDCNTSIVNIDGSGSTGGSNLSFEWTTINGHIISATNTSNIEVDSAGNYELTVTNDDNGCTHDTLVVIDADFANPIISILEPDTIDCIIENFSLDASESSGSDSLSFEWTTTNGNIVSGDSTATPEIDLPGVYFLILTNEENGCTAMDSVEVLGNTDPPNIEIDPPSQLTCSILEITLDASSSSPGVNFNWTTQDGNIVSGENGPLPVVDETGMYQLIITDTLNGCTSIDSVAVLGDQGVPVAEAGQTIPLDCNTTSGNLDGTGSATGTDITYLWTTSDGNLLNGETGLFPTINSGGTYTLLVTNSATGCSSSDSVTIPQNNDLPIADVIAGDTLNCFNATVIINATNSSSGAGFTFNWTTQNGNIVSGENTLEPEVDQSGIYILSVTNLSSNCTLTDSVFVNQNFAAPQAVPGQPVTLTCADPTLQLDGSGSVFGNNVDILWTTNDGNIEDGETTLTPTVSEPGTYMLTITNLESGCMDADSIEVEENMVPPTADAGPPSELTCAITSLSLDGSGSSQNGNFTYLWSTQNGNIANGENGLTPTIDLDGTYLLTVVNDDNGCESTSEVTIGLNTVLPNAEAGPTAELTCEITETALIGTGDSGSQFDYLWTTFDGNIILGDTTLAPVVSATGTYTLVITNQNNGCTSQDEVVITENTTLPNVDAGPTNELSCTLTQLMLNGNGSAPGNNLDFLWTTQDGNILSGETSLNPIINEAGIYVLTIIDNENGCADSSSVLITQDANVPIAESGTAPMLTCDITTILLNGAGSSTGAGINYEWTSTDGNILTGENSLNPEIDAPGSYLLTVTDVLNNCQAFSSITIDENVLPPTADAGPEGLLTCANTQLMLDATASDNGAGFSFAWSTQNGNLVSGENTVMPVVDAPGTYQLLVTNLTTGCTNTANVDVLENTDPPDVLIDFPAELTCDILILTLDATSSSTGSEFNYLWTTSNGNILSGEDSSTPIINEPGTYGLLITNDLTGCSEFSSIEVLEDVEQPTASAGLSAELNCNITNLALDGTGSSTGNDFFYQWTTSNGNIISGGTTLTPSVNEPGEYLLTVSNNINGCTSTSEVVITLDDNFPVIEILIPEMLTCKEEETTIDATNSSIGSAFGYEWTTQNGNVVNGQNTLLLTVDAPGLYVLTILNNENGCETTASVNVDEDVVLPQVDAGNGIELHCNLPEASLQGSTDLNNGTFTFSWSTANGSILSGAQSLTPIVDAPGVYELVITNTVTGCTETDNVLVTENVLQTFDFETTDPTCLNPSGVLQFTDIQGGTAPFSYSINGQGFSSETIYTNLSPGVYDIVVQDANDCKLSDVAYLSEPPEFLVSLETQVLIELGESYQINTLTTLPASEIASVEWTPSETLSCDDCLNPIATPIQQTTYEVIVTSNEGCTASAPISIIVSKNVDIYVPNAFSPNGDGINDVFLIYAGGNAIAEINSFLIFSRWGESVFEYYNFSPNDPQFGWDGKFRNEILDPAVFIWFAEVELIDGSKRLLEGGVNLVK